jgi:hypothetical protein
MEGVFGLLRGLHRIIQMLAQSGVMIRTACFQLMTVVKSWLS